MSFSTPAALHHADADPGHYGGKQYLKEKSNFADKPFYASKLVNYLDERYPHFSLVLEAAECDIDISLVLSVPEENFVPDATDLRAVELYRLQEDLSAFARETEKSAYTNGSAAAKLKIRTNLMAAIRLPCKSVC